MQGNEDKIQVLYEMITNRNRSVGQLSDIKPVLLVFLRHFGCTFCREALADIASRQQTILQSGVGLVFVHMGDAEMADHYFRKYKLPDAEYVSDSGCIYYAAMGLAKGNFSQLLGLSVMIRGMEAGILKGHGFGRFLGDGFQMPGVFLIEKGTIREQFVHRLSSDRPDYDALIACCAL